MCPAGDAPKPQETSSVAVSNEEVSCGDGILTLRPRRTARIKRQHGDDSIQIVSGETMVFMAGCSKSVGEVSPSAL